MLLKFVKEWLENPDWWFCPRHSFDGYLNDKYGGILDLHISSDIGEIRQRALCIAYDQLPRHMYRGQSSNHIIQYFLIKSLDIFNTLPSLDDVHGNELCLLLLPLRHTNDPKNIFRAIEIMWKRICNSDDASEIGIYKKFLKASYERCPIIGGGNWDNIEVTEYPLEILDYKGSPDIDKPFFPQHSIVEMFAKHIRGDRYIISLSGGVDSMVGAYIAAHTLGKDKCCFVHINYNNRDTSNDEEMFVRYWSTKWGIRLYVRKFTEINRPLCMKYEMREVYETYTRNVRYACYREAWTKAKVILLHNQDDCFENIMTNITQKGKYENLLGMTHESVQDGICFIRPFLDIPKAQLIQYAHAVGIPYLYDSTPKWSQRGKIRDNIVPVLSSWNTGCIPAFFELSNHVKGLHTIVDNYVGMILKDVVVRDNGIIEIRNVKELPRDITVWRKMLSKLDLPQPSTKSIQMFIKRNTQVCAVGHLSKYLDIEFSNEIIIFKKSFCPPAQ